MENKIQNKYALFDVLPDGYLVLDSNLKIQFWNEVIQLWSGIPKENAYGKSFEEIIDEPEKKFKTQKIIEVYKTGVPLYLSSMIHSYLIPCPIGTKNFQKHEYYFIKDIELDTIVVCIKNMTQTKTTVSNYKRALADAKESKQEALNAYRAKSQFLASMSHEIRTPMNGILGMCELLLEDNQAQHIYDSLNVVNNCGKHLMSLIDDILLYSKIDIGKDFLQLKPVSLPTFIEGILKILKPKSEEKNLDLIFNLIGSSQKKIFLDEKKLGQIIYNLLGNAIKFTEKGTIHFIIEIKPTHENNASMVFSIRDQGIGIKEENIESIFNPFHRGHIEHIEGTGLGLSISQKLANLMGTKIHVKSEMGKGSTFFFELPVEISHLNCVKDTNTKEKVLDSNLGIKIGIDILLVEDNEINQLVISKLLSKMNFKVDIATNGLEALKKIQNKSYELILMDVQMPKMNGIEATQSIRKFDIAQPIIIALTANAFQEDKDKCFRAGMNDFISKPLDKRKLVDKIKKYFLSAA